MTERKETRLRAGTIVYHEAGNGPVLLFAHGLFANAALWSKVIPLLSDRYRCIAPEWPLGSHPVALGPTCRPTSSPT